MLQYFRFIPHTYPWLKIRSF